MRQDGICVVGGNFYTKQIEFLDINYQLAQNEDKNIIFENWCDFLNYFDASIRFQLSFLNQKADMENSANPLRYRNRTTSLTGSGANTPVCCGGSSHGGIMG